MTKEIPLNKDYFAIVDDEDYEWLSQWTWKYWDPGYAVRLEYLKGTSRKIYMHRIIMNTPKGMWTDHINHNPLDNRRSNLRICTAQENHRNRSRIKKEKTSQYKGVCWHKKDRKWRAVIHAKKGKSVFLGGFDSQQEAALAYNQAAIKYFGEFAYINHLESSGE